MSELGWRPILDLPGALQPIVEWFQHWQVGSDMQKIPWNRSLLINASNNRVPTNSAGSES
jgi:hypothetical protein